jgi:hypothetical protein
MIIGDEGDDARYQFRKRSDSGRHNVSKGIALSTKSGNQIAEH